MDDHNIILTPNPGRLVARMLADMADLPDRVKLLTAYILEVAKSECVEETLRDEYVNVVSKGMHALPVPPRFAQLWIDSDEHIFQPISEAVLVDLGPKGLHSDLGNIKEEGDSNGGY